MKTGAKFFQFRFHFIPLTGEFLLILDIAFNQIADGKHQIRLHPVNFVQGIFKNFRSVATCPVTDDGHAKHWPLFDILPAGRLHIFRNRDACHQAGQHHESSEAANRIAHEDHPRQPRIMLPPSHRIT